jgi:ATP-binding cassette subfamily F protein 3
VKPGHNVLTDYFAQDQYKELDPNKKMLEDMSGAAPRIPTTELRTLLGCFLFRDDDVFKRLGVLSGGERNRYALARMLVSPANFLLLDEPTNHLDLRAKDVLLEALRGFTGTAVFVSHDRYFLDAVATRVIEVLDHHVTVYPGNYEDYLWRKAGGAEALGAKLAEERAEISTPAVQPVAALAPSHNGAGAKRMNPIKRKQMEDKLAAAEAAVPQLEAAIIAAENAMAEFVSAEQTQRLAEELAALRARHADAIKDWESLSSALERG